jgi:3-hydroxymyristoyl/3-hydroxydecanoyl-(acyl carrier protein) dehydratase
MSATEISRPPLIQKAVRYTIISTDAEHRGREINWTAISEKGPFDVVIISDSFMGGGAGKDLSRKISADNNVSVLHIFTNNMEYGEANQTQVLVLLTNNGFLKNTGAGVVILEIAERALPSRVLLTDPERSDPLPKHRQEYRADSRQDLRAPETDVNFLRNLNESITTLEVYFSNSSRDLITLKTWIKNDILSLTASETSDKTLFFYSINESRFTNPVYASRLIFLQSELSFHRSDYVYPDEYITVNNKLNIIAGKLRDQNITLIFLPVASPYTIYYPYIIDPPTVRNPLFEILRTLDRSYVLVDTKEIADTLQKNGEKDLYGVGDPSHWTWRLTEAVRKEIDLSAKPGLNRTPQDKAEEYDRAVRELRAVIYERGEPDDPWADAMDGRIYERAQDFPNATRCYLKSLDRDPRQPDIRARLRNITSG